MTCGFAPIEADRVSIFLASVSWRRSACTHAARPRRTHRWRRQILPLVAPGRQDESVAARARPRQLRERDRLFLATTEPSPACDRVAACVLESAGNTSVKRIEKGLSRIVGPFRPNGRRASPAVSTYQFGLLRRHRQSHRAMHRDDQSFRLSGLRSSRTRRLLQRVVSVPEASSDA